MADDIKINWDDIFQEGDIAYIDGDLEREPGLGTAVFMSLFTDRRARDDDPLDDKDDKRGWWGDQTSTYIDDEIGSRLWLLDRAKTTTENYRLARIYIEEALQWLISDGVAAKVETEIERAGVPGNDRLYFKVKIYKIDGNVEAYKFEDCWTGQYR